MTQPESDRKQTSRLFGKIPRVHLSQCCRYRNWSNMSRSKGARVFPIAGLWFQWPELVPCSSAVYTPNKVNHESLHLGSRGFEHAVHHHVLGKRFFFQLWKNSVSKHIKVNGPSYGSITKRDRDRERGDVTAISDALQDVQMWSFMNADCVSSVWFHSVMYHGYEVSVIRTCFILRTLYNLYRGPIKSRNPLQIR
jgi:hypothetical protein